jgi:two-component system response regulator AtoC/two-component system nitrogen regulation response regulator NtrX
MEEVRARVGRIAGTDFTVLIEGESGVGKELVAREIHARSARRLGPFVAVNCAALVETLVEAELFGIEDRTATGVRGRRGRFELADRGTLFLDEVADLSSAAQAKLLRVLQDMAVERVGGCAPRQVDTRVIAATNRSLDREVEAGRFRLDLYYRLAGVEILVPPLRHRREDIAPLAAHFLDQHRPTRQIGLSGAAREALIVYDWPGNVRQLARVLERAVALAPGPEILIDDLPADVARQSLDLRSASLDRDESLRAWCSRYVRVVLERCGGNKRRACELLDISYHKLQAHLDYESAPRFIPLSAPAVVSGRQEKADTRNEGVVARLYEASARAV